MLPVYGTRYRLDLLYSIRQNFLGLIEIFNRTPVYDYRAFST